MRAVCLSFLLLIGCYKSKDPNVTTFQVKTKSKTNGGLPFYIMTKAIDPISYRVENYSKIATQAWEKSDPDERVKTYFIMPGQKKTITVGADENRSPAIYFLFTEPGEEWSYLSRKDGKHKVKIMLGESEIEASSDFEE